MAFVVPDAGITCGRIHSEENWLRLVSCTWATASTCKVPSLPTPYFTSAFGAKADMTGTCCVPVPVANDPEQTSDGAGKLKAIQKISAT